MEYEIIAFEKGDFQDAHGNYWCNIALKGVSEPVRIVVKDPTKYEAGQKIYGKITDETSKTNKPYRRFRKEVPPEGSPAQAKADQTDEYWNERNNAIRAQWAIGQANNFLTVVNTDGELDMAKVEGMAKSLFAMVDRIAGADISYQEELGQKLKERTADEINLDEIPF